MFAIQGTNDSSITSKLSSTIAGYYSDKFLKCLCAKYKRRCPLINRGYYIRYKTLESVFDSWFKLLDVLNLAEHQIVSLGAGFDTSYFKLKEEKKLKSCKKFVEIDFPEVAKRKYNCIVNCKMLNNCFEEGGNSCCNMQCKEEIVFCKNEYTLIGLDLNDVELFITTCKAANLDFNYPTLFFSECAVTYMDVEKSDSLILSVKHNFPNSVFSIYEQVYPFDGFGLIMLNHFQTIGSPLKSILKYSDRKCQKARFLQMGWPICKVIGIDHVWFLLPHEEKNRVSELEPFDEYETWHQKCFHYSVSWACQGLMIRPDSFYDEGMFLPERTYIKGCDDMSWRRQRTAIPILRYGHQIVKLTDETFLMFGGFGDVHHKHQRLKELACGNIHGGSFNDVAVQDDQKVLGARIYHSMVCLSDKRIIVYGGRSAPKKPYCKTILLHEKNDSSFAYAVGSSDRSKSSKSKLQYLCKAVVEQGTKPEPRWRHSSDVIVMNGIECMFVFGGCTAEKKATNDSYFLDTTNWTWIKVCNNEKTPSPRHSHSSVVHSDGQVIISGGLSEEEKTFNTIYAFDVTSQSWNEIKIKGILPRYSHTSHIFDEKLFLCGGTSSCETVSPYICCIDLEKKIAVEINMPGQDPEFPVLLHNHCSLLDKDEIVVLGGGGNCFSFGTHFNQHLLHINLADIVKNKLL